MIKSMTGYGKGEYGDMRRHITVEIKSVNHRYIDIYTKMPRRYTFAEEKIKGLVKEKIKRGKIEIAIQVENLGEDDVRIRLNTMVAKQYLDNLKELKEAFALEGEPTLQYIAGLPDVIKAIPDVESEEEVTKALEEAVGAALAAHTTMRETEGRILAEDLVMRKNDIKSHLAEIEERAPLLMGIYKEKLENRINNLIGKEVELSQERISLEAAIFADKASITEELVRLDSHLKQMEEIIIGERQSDGKKLDFLIQEMNRETNTIGSKANDLEITNVMLEIKSQVEKIREQVQNIE